MVDSGEVVDDVGVAMMEIVLTIGHEPFFTGDDPRQDASS